MKPPPVAKKKRRGIVDYIRRSTTLNVLEALPLYVPHSAGKYKPKALLTIQAARQVFPALSALSRSTRGELLAVEDIDTVPETDQERGRALALKERLDFYGSDKADDVHHYHNLYGCLLRDRDKVGGIFEIGLGTNNTDVVSTMGRRGRPGASLRAFRDYCPNARIYGADVDRRILFTEERIDTFFVDQTDPATFNELLGQLPRTFDLVIDDGLHSPNANVESLRFGLEIVRPGGWVVIEDIESEAICLWQVVAALLPSRYRCHLYRGKGAIVFAVQRLN